MLHCLSVARKNRGGSKIVISSYWLAAYHFNFGYEDAITVDRSKLTLVATRWKYSKQAAETLEPQGKMIA